MNAPIFISRRRQRGQALAELAVLLPLLVLLLLGAVDFGRLYRAFVAVESAAATGAQYACSSPAHAANTNGIRIAALSQAMDITNFSPVVNTTVVNSNVVVTVSATYRTLVRWPGITNSVPLQRVAIMRVMP
jgi:Flp pilus assembly protein TadG